MKFYIKNLTTYNEMLQVHGLQSEIWGLQEPNFGIYPPLMNTAAKNGGVILGAFDATTDGMIAFLFGFLGREPGGPFKLCSQIMGVLPAWRAHGVGEALKLAQRRQVLAQGLPLITWTFDPLEGLNAYLNLHKLRGISRTYWRNVYGENFGSLNAGLPSDRLVVEWWIAGPRLAATPQLDPANFTPVFETTGSGLARQVTAAHLNLTAEHLRVETPPDIQALKNANLALAREWRLQVRAALENYFATGYIAIDFITRLEPDSRQRRNCYLLQKTTPALPAEIGIET